MDISIKTFKKYFFFDTILNENGKWVIRWERLYH